MRFYKPLRSADVSETSTQDAARGAAEDFAELIRILDDAIARATRVHDPELVEKLTLARGAAEHSAELLEKLRAIVPSEDESRI